MHPDRITISFLDGVVLSFGSDEFKSFSIGKGVCSLVVDGMTHIYPLSTIKFINLTH